MSERNSISRTLAVRYTRIHAAAGGIITGAIALTALPIVWLVEEPSATAACAVAFSFAGLLLFGAVTANRQYRFNPLLINLTGG
jgi:hypothetical protein